MVQRFFLLLGGLVAGIALVLVGGFLIAINLADWMVVSAGPRQADAVVILGGGDGSRLRKGLELYDKGNIRSLILVDVKKEAWWYVLKKQCPDCDLKGKNITILEGSTSTITDAQLSLAFCRNNGIHSVLVVTSPYHTRRADLTFGREFNGSGIKVQTIGTDDFGQLLKPEERWWKDRRTLETVWLEFGKILYGQLNPVLELWHGKA